MQMQLDFPVTMSPQKATPLPPMVSKRQLCLHFQISSKTLRTTILTDAVLMAAGYVWERTEANEGVPTVQSRHLLPPNLTKMVYQMHGITMLFNQ